MSDNEDDSNNKDSLNKLLLVRRAERSNNPKLMKHFDSYSSDEKESHSSSSEFSESESESESKNDSENENESESKKKGWL